MATTSQVRVQFDAFDLDEANARLTRHGRPLALPPRAFAVLCALARHPGQLVTKSDLLDAVWGHQFVSDSVLKTTVSEVRAVLGDDARQPRYIETASRRGYRFIGVLGARPGSVVEQMPEPLPPLRGDVTIVGREDPLQRLRAAWRLAQQGTRQLCWVSGEAGVGKTTLIDAFVDSLEGTALVVRGHCVEPFGQGEPYLPVLEILGTLGRMDERVVALARAAAPTWLLQLPWLSSEAEREALGRQLAGTHQERMLREGAELLDRCAALRPLVLVTEDLHWSDHATVRLIDAVARRRDAARMLWIGSFRTAELVAQEHPLNGVRHELRLRRLCEELALEPFSEREVGDVLTRRFPQGEFDEAFVRELHHQSDGLPLFVVNVIDDMAAHGTLGKLDRDELHQVPESLAGVMEKQIGRLGAPMRLVLEAAAVCGREFRAQTVADALGQSAQAVSEMCDQLVKLNYWLRHLALEGRPDGSLDALYAFRHALYRELFYQRSGAVARANWHRRIAESLSESQGETRKASPGEVALHYERGLDPLMALHHYVLAADHALRHFAPTEATQLVGRGLALLPLIEQEGNRDELELALVARRGIAGAQLHGVTSEQVIATLERGQALSEQMPTSPELAWSLSGMGWVLFARGDFSAARALATRMEGLGREQRDNLLAALACTLMGVTLGYQGAVQEGSAQLDRGLALYAALGERLQRTPMLVDPWVASLAYSSLLLQVLGRSAAARERARLAIERAEAIGQLNAREIAYRFAAIVAERQGDAEVAAAQARKQSDLVAQHAFTQGEGPSHWMRGIARVRQGDPASGHALIVEGLTRRRQQGMPYNTTQVLAYAAEAKLALGDLAAAQAHVDDGLAVAEQLGERLFLPDLLVLSGRIALARGERDAARDALRRSAGAAQAQHSTEQAANALVALCAIAPVQPADRRALADLQRQLAQP